MNDIIEKITEYFYQGINNIELFSYFSVEIFYVIGIILNIILFIFFKKKLNVRRMSDVSTFCIFILNFLISASILIKNSIFFGDFNLSIFNGRLIIDSQNMLLECCLNLFFILFILSTYRITKKARYKTTLTNTALLFIALFSLLLIKIDNPILAFVFLDISAFFVYKFSSNARISKKSPHCSDFITLSLSSTILFYAFYIISYLVKVATQIAVVNVCMSCALLSKAGILPVYNYSLYKCDKNNAPSAILLYNYLPFLAVITFLKFIQNIDYSNKIYFVAICAFLSITILVSAIYAFKVKDMARYLANCFYIFSAMHILAILTLPNNTAIIDSLLLFVFAFLGINSLLCIFNINYKTEKINLASLKGLFIKNRKFCIIFSTLLLIIANIIPSILLLNNTVITQILLSQNKLGSLIITAILFAYLLIILSALKIIKNIYSKKEHFQPVFEFTKRTTLNYVVPCLIILFLIIKMFL